MILEGDCLDKLKELENDSIDLVCTDPPYGYSFMNRDWDRAVPTVEVWQECLRVLKPGAFCMVMSAPRSDVQMHMIQNLTEAGFRLDFTPIYWTYASGFPKAGNIGKMVDKRLGAERERVPIVDISTGKNKTPDIGGGSFKRGEEFTAYSGQPLTDQAKALDGSYAGFQPKPAVEVIIVAMKPLSEKTFVDQALKNGKGVTWLNDCRIPTDLITEPNARPNAASYNLNKDKRSGSSHLGKMRKEMATTGAEGRDHGHHNSQGRFPANLLVSDDVLKKQTSSHGGGTMNPHSVNNWLGKNTDGRPIPKGDSGTYSRYFDLDKWAQGRFPANLLVSDDVLNDGKITKSTIDKSKHAGKPGKTWFQDKQVERIQRGDSGSYSRYFDLDKIAKANGWDTYPFAIVPKASKREKNEGLEQIPDKLSTTHGGKYRICRACGKRSMSGTKEQPQYRCQCVEPDWEVVVKEGERYTTKNHHPTVKPLKLMSYLITLASRPGDIVLDPFCGSGTTCLAAKKLNREYIGIEKEAEYAEIANARLNIKVQGSLL